MVAPNDPTLAQALRLGDTIADAGADILSEGNYGGDELTIAKAIVGCTIIDGLVAILAVLRSYGQAHADTIARSLFEALGDLYHLYDDKRDPKRTSLAKKRPLLLFDARRVRIPE